MLDLYIAMHTKRINVGELGFVLPAHDPLRVASDIAVLDQMSQGRALRRLRTRHPGTLAEYLRAALFARTRRQRHRPGRAYAGTRRTVRGRLCDHSQSLHCDTFSFKGKYWQIPAPRLKWTGAAVTREAGKGVDAEGRLTEVGIAPRCYNNRLPTCFEPFASRPTRARRPRRVARYRSSSRSIAGGGRGTWRMAQEGWARGGRNTRLGEGVGLVRYILVADTKHRPRCGAATSAMRSVPVRWSGRVMRGLATKAFSTAFHDAALRR